MNTYDYEYETILRYSKTCNRSFGIAENPSEAVLPSFGAYCLLRCVGFADWDIPLYHDYLALTSGVDGEPLTQMLSFENRETARGLIELYYEFDLVKKELAEAAAAEPGRISETGHSQTAVSVRISETASSHPAASAQISETASSRSAASAQLCDRLLAPGVLENLFGISLSQTSNLRIHISQAFPTDALMFSFQNVGVLLVIGADANIPNLLAESFDSYLNAFKALADESRLKIVSALLYDTLTVSEIAAKVGLTLPTVNHHIKSLMTAGIVAMEISGTPGRGVRYMLNRDKCGHLLQGIEMLISRREQ